MEKLTQREKAFRYEVVLKELEDVVERMQSISDEIENVEKRQDVIDMQGNPMYQAYLLGILSAKGFTIDINLASAKSTLKNYKS